MLCAKPWKEMSRQCLGWSGDSRDNNKSEITFKKLACEVEGGDRAVAIGRDVNIFFFLEEITLLNKSRFKQPRQTSAQTQYHLNEPLYSKNTFFHCNSEARKLQTIEERFNWWFYTLYHHYSYIFMLN